MPERPNAALRNEPARRTGEKLMKRGSFLCHISCCYHYRTAGRSSVAADCGASNAGMWVFCVA
jgi:sulfatase modifying factor 1